ncbi:MAG: ethanolamine ammonia-lyase subunit EutC [Ruminococcaceae bacterium]|nr:ethanolamine ammonia-lyase subunit EutC [Oscillospiraceae bacterium]
MNKEDLKAMVAQMLTELHAQPTVKASEYTPTRHAETESVADITAIDLRAQYLVEKPHDAKAFQALKNKTPARLASGRAGSRYKTITMLRFRADHAAAQDSAFSLVHEDFAKENDLIPVKTECKDKDEYLTRPDLGRRFDEVYQKVISESCKGHRVLIVVGDGLSSAAIEANAMDCVATIEQGLKARGIDYGKKLFVQFCRVGAGDHIGDLTDCELVCMLVGERPGLVTSESMSAYITYRPHRGIAESKRTVVSNIHSQGIAAVEAGAHIASLIEKMLKQKASGIDFVQEAGA